MTYNLVITPHTESQIEHALNYVGFKLQNHAAVISILEDIDSAFNILETVPESFPLCDDPNLRRQGYHKISLKHHSYLFVYRMDMQTIYLLGFFHMLEDYTNKL